MLPYIAPPPLQAPMRTHRPSNPQPLLRPGDSAPAGANEQTPTLMTHGDADQVITLERAQRSVAGLTKPGFEFKVYPGLGEFPLCDAENTVRCCQAGVQACDVDSTLLAAMLCLACNHVNGGLPMALHIRAVCLPTLLPCNLPRGWPAALTHPALALLNGSPVHFICAAAHAVRDDLVDDIRTLLTSQLASAD